MDKDARYNGEAAADSQDEGVFLNGRGENDIFISCDHELNGEYSTPP